MIRWGPVFFASAVAAVSFSGCEESHERPPAGTLTIGARVDDFPTRPERSQLGLYPLSLNICEPLVRLRADYTVEPLLATRWEYRGNNTWRFHLRPGIRFSDGRPFTSEAVRWTIEVASRREPHTYLDADSVNIIDDLTIDLTPTRTNLRLVDQLLHPGYGILAPGSEPASGPIGTGPFKFAGYRRDEWIAVERNDSYWGEKPNLRRMHFRFLPDDTTRVLSLESGEVDMILDVPFPQAKRLAGERGVRILRSPVGRVASLLLNRGGAPPHDLLRDIRLRRAIAHAIDRKTLIRDVWNGYGTPVATLGPPALLGPFQSRVRGIVYDPKRATELLDGAGWLRGDDGIRVKGARVLELTLIAWPEFDNSVLEFLHNQLHEVGIRLHILRFPDSLSYASRLNSGAFDLDLEAANQNDGDPIFLPALRFYSKSPVKSTPYFALGERFDDIIAAGLEATDRAEVQRLSAEAMHAIVDEDVVAIPLAGLGRIYALSDEVTGFIPHPSQLNQQWTGLSRSR